MSVLVLSCQASIVIVMEEEVLEKVESVLDKYRDMICNVNDRFSFGRKVMGEWFSTKILILGTSMTNVDFY